MWVVPVSKMMTDEEKERECLFCQAKLGFMAAYCKGIFDLLIAKLAQKKLYQLLEMIICFFNSPSGKSEQ